MKNALFAAFNKLGWQKSPASQFVWAVAQALSAKGPKTRKMRLLHFLAEQQENRSTRSKGEAGSLATWLAHVITSMPHHVEKAFWSNAVEQAKVKLQAIDVNEPKLGNCTTQQQAVDAIKSGLSKVQAIIDDSTVTTAVSVHLANQTRWHSSVFMSYYFVAQNLQDLIKFFLDEHRADSSSMTKILELSSKVVELQVDLEAYVRALFPVAQLLDNISDSADHYTVLDWDSDLAATIESMETDDTADDRCKEIQKHVSQALLEYKPRQEETTFWKLCKFLSPAAYYPVKPSEPVPTADGMQKALNIPIDAVEWEKFTSACKDGKYFSETPQKFWESPKARTDFPNIAPNAEYIAALPVVATGCDSVLSVETAVFSKRQGQLDPDFAGNWIRARHNGALIPY